MGLSIASSLGRWVRQQTLWSDPMHLESVHQSAFGGNSLTWQFSNEAVHPCMIEDSCRNQGSFRPTFNWVVEDVTDMTSDETHKVYKLEYSPNIN